MRFEKLNENKLRITLTVQDLQEKEINFHDFMSNSLETQDLFLDILEEAEEKVGFNTKDYKVKIEALAMADGDFIVTITRAIPEIEKNRIATAVPKKKFKVCRKKQETSNKQALYRFESFDDYYLFIQFLSQGNLANATTIAKKSILYCYKNRYYLLLDEVNIEHKDLLKFYSSITEFGTYINSFELFISKLNECGKTIIKSNALKTSLKHFKNKKITD